MKARTWLAGLAAGAVSLTLVAPGIASSAPVQEEATAKSPEVRTIETPKAGGAGLVTKRDATGRAHSVRPATPLKAPASVSAKAGKSATSKPDAAAVAKAQVAAVAPYFGARPSDLVAQTSTLSEYGSQTRFQQVIDGVQVYGGEIVTSLDKSGALEAANGEVALATYGTFPAADKADAAKTTAQNAAVQAVATRGKLDAGKLTAKLQGPRWFDLGLVTRQPGSVAIPVYLYDVTGAGDVRWQAIVHASGQTLLAWDMAEHLNRVICDADRAIIQTGNEDVRCGTVFPSTRAEGEAPSAVQDVNQVYEYFGDTSDTYASLGTDLTELIGVDYGDGKGKALRGTVRICVDGGCPFANAFWNGEQMAFGEGVSTDDVTGHELTHGVTQHTSGLAYLWEAGAINESFSDILGEFVDLTNGSADDTAANRWQIGEGSSLGVIRSMSDPTQFGDPDRMRSANWFDDEFFQDNGGVHLNSGVGNKTAYLIADGGAFNGQKMLGIGLARSEVLWHETQKVLTSGADYGDLAEGLRSTCTKLAKKKKKSGMTKADCAQVELAIKATELDFEPALGKPAQAPVCDTTGAKAKNLFKTSFAEYPDGKVVRGEGWVLGKGEGLEGSLVDTSYSQDGDDSMLGVVTEPEGSISLQTANGTKIKNAKTYLRFTHAYNFYNVFIIFGVRTGAATMEYSDNGGATWKDTSALTWKNGPTVDPNFDDEPAAWHGNSGGWETSRLDLSEFTGKQLKFRWTGHGKDFADLIPGNWWLDNATIYNCSK